MKELFILSAILLLFGALPGALADSDRLVVLATKSGDITIEFFPDDAPRHVENFITLAEDGFYNGTVFHRVIEGFMIQGGDPKTKPGAYESVAEWGTGDPGHTVDAEFNNIKHNRGIVSMARSAAPDSAGSQFFIVHQNSNFLDGQYTVFGRIVTQESFETLDRIAALETAPGETVPLQWGDTEILSARVVDRDSVADLLEQGEPERGGGLPTRIAGGPYTNEDLGISFDAPEGWMLQEPQKTDPIVPDLIMLGPRTGGVGPVISITADPRDGRSLDEKITETNDLLQDAMDSGQLEITFEERTSINAVDAYIKSARALFVSGSTTTEIGFKEVILAAPETFYTLTYNNRQDAFENHLPEFDDVLYSFSVHDGGKHGDPACLIATAAYGSELAPQVQMLREIRDGTLMSTESGAAFMAGFNTIYYSFSPAVADLEREHPVFREAVRLLITPMLSTLSVMTLAEKGSESQVLALGISVIALNLGMYAAAPALLVGAATRRRLPRRASCTPARRGA